VPNACGSPRSRWQARGSSLILGLTPRSEAWGPGVDRARQGDERALGGPRLRRGGAVGEAPALSAETCAPGRLTPMPRHPKSDKRSLLRVLLLAGAGPGGNAPRGP